LPLKQLLLGKIYNYSNINLFSPSMHLDNISNRKTAAGSEISFYRVSKNMKSN